MEIGSYSASPAVSVPKLVQARFSSGRVTMPVRSSQYLYARFKNVAGVPAPGGSGGFSISRLRSIDVLIDRLKQVKRNPEMKDDRSLDAMIDQLSSKLHMEAVKADQSPYIAVPSGTFEGVMVDFSL